MLRVRLPRWPKSAKRGRLSRRAAVRFAPRQEILCYCGLGPDAGYVRARVYDVSAGGACLLLKRPVEAGTVMEVEMVNGPHTFLCARTLRVLRVFQGKGGECVVAGEFDRKLGYDELLPFVL
jgi:hypothetical protein